MAIRKKLFSKKSDAPKPKKPLFGAGRKYTADDIPEYIKRTKNLHKPLSQAEMDKKWKKEVNRRKGKK